jgi:flagellar biosynthesis protein FlhG
VKVLAITSGKGGVGKSTLSLNIARQLSLGGKRTLMVDFDIHNKGITNLFLPRIANSTVSVTEIVAASNGFSDELSAQFIASLNPVSLDKELTLFFLPASRPTEMMDWQNFVAPNEAIVHFFSKVFENIGVAGQFDVILIDCYGGIDSLTVAATGVADDTIIVNEPDIITFGGTLTLYAYVQRTYAAIARKPRIHFVINRIPGRYSFRFLNSEYKKHLANLSIDRNILAYFPYDKLLLETFGDYPFFSELLPRGLFTRKIRLLIATMWQDSGYADFVTMSPRKRARIFTRTSETGFADPEAILHAMVILPFYLLIPLLLLLGLYFGVGGSLNYAMLVAIIYTAGISGLILGFIIGAFEPIQISRWLWREETYRRRKMKLTRRHSVAYRVTSSIVRWFVALIPSLVSSIVIVGACYVLFEARDVLWNSSGNLKEVSIWPGEISGLHAGGHYSGFHLNPRATIRPGTDLSRADFSDAVLDAVQFSKLNFDRASFVGSSLVDTWFKDVNLERANFSDAVMHDVIFENVDLSGADFDDVSVSFILKGTRNRFANGNLKADFRSSTLNFTDRKVGAFMRNSGALMPDPALREYRLAAPKRLLPDMIESLIIQGRDAQGGDAHLEEAKRLLGEWGEELSHDPAAYLGQFRLLSVLYSEMSGSVDQVAKRNWCQWIQKHDEVSGWEWVTWDTSIRNRSIPSAIMDHLTQIEDAARGEPVPNIYCIGSNGRKRHTTK